MDELTIKHSIRSEMRLRTNAELLDIWVKNNHYEWTDDAFEVVRELLVERIGSVPQQGKPNYQQVDSVDHDISSFLKSTSFLTGWLLFLFGMVIVLGGMILELFYGKDVPSVYVKILFVLAMPFPIASGIVMIVRREVVGKGSRIIKGRAAVIQGAIFVFIFFLAEIILIYSLLKEIPGN